MAVCETYQIPHSQYLGGPGIWTALDRIKAEEYARWKRGQCQHCGVREEWFDPKRGGHRHAMVAEAERCPGCELKAQLEDQLHDARKEGASTRGVHVQLIPNPGVYGPFDDDDEDVA